MGIGRDVLKLLKFFANGALRFLALSLVTLVKVSKFIARAFEDPGSGVSYFEEDAKSQRSRIRVGDIEGIIGFGEIGRMRREIRGEIKRIRMELEGLRDLVTVSPELYSVPDFYHSGVENWNGEFQRFKGKKSKKRKRGGSEVKSKKPKKLKKHDFYDYRPVEVYCKPNYTFEFTGFEGERRRRTKKKKSNKKNYRKRQGRRNYGYWDPFAWDYA
ncbi:MAG: hypothetical protein QXO16_02170 [Archaeoglobaceae archaeon]